MQKFLPLKWVVKYLYSEYGLIKTGNLSSAKEVLGMLVGIIAPLDSPYKSTFVKKKSYQCSLLQSPFASESLWQL